jgi:hypothetical protein
MRHITMLSASLLVGCFMWAGFAVAQEGTAVPEPRNPHRHHYHHRVVHHHVVRHHVAHYAPREKQPAGPTH